MNESEFRLPNAPIVEAVLDIGCDMPPGFSLAAIEAPSRESFKDQYPKSRTLFFQETQIEAKPDAAPQMSVQHGIQAFQFLQEDLKQLVQVRTQGFSFNRLAPYRSLDDYLAEIQRTWKLFVSLTAPIQVRSVQLRYINRISLPATSGRVQLDDYLKIGPPLPREDNLTFVGFLNQQLALEEETGNTANVVLTTQPHEGDKLPIIFDICVANNGAAEPEDWPWILARILSLRALKNRIFRNTLTERCLSLFQ